MTDCRHLWTYRKGHSECIRCGTTAADGRGLPHGHYAVNGIAMMVSKLIMSYACPTCLSNVNPRMVDGKLRVLCAGKNAHDIEQMGRAITKERRDAILRKQEQDYHYILDGLPPELRKEILKCQ